MISLTYNMWRSDIMRIFIALIQALLFVISSFSVQDSNFKFMVDRAAYSMATETDIHFDTMDASEYEVTEEERELCRQWYEDNILYAPDNGNAPAYDFTVCTKSLRSNLSDWSFTVGEESAVGEKYRGGKTTLITLTHNKHPLKAVVEATIYEENASCEWTVYIKNEGEENSQVISELYAINSTLPTGKNAELYFSKGSEPAPDDFELLKTELSPIAMKFTANGGRTESFLPYFNINGENSGAVVCVGWSGQWFASFETTLDGQVRAKAKQEKLRGYLEPGEEIRSPSVNITFYKNDNALKGFNSFRNFTVDCVYPEGTRQVTTSGLGVENLSLTEEQLIKGIGEVPDYWAETVDYYWVDAGWYVYNNDWSDSVGTWVPNPERFPDGFKRISDTARQRGIEFLLWYEPERACKGTEVYNECIKHDGWIILDDENDSRNLVNLANEDCFRYITDLIVDSLIYNGVDCFRMDFNITPGAFWDEADKEFENGRRGFTENHYVTNLYRFLDELLLRVDGLTIDICASGGKRVDIECIRRGIPLWRSDYNCTGPDGSTPEDILTATQSQTYGLSFWLVHNGTCAYRDGEYADRTNIISSSQRLGYVDIRKHLVGNYYPLADGGLDTEKYLAMQFDTDAQRGMALIYKRENVKDNTYHLVLNGLESDSLYKVCNYDTPNESITKTGKELMTEGISIVIEEAPEAEIIMYEKA